MSDFRPTPDDQRLADEERAGFDAVAVLVKESKEGYKTTEFWTMVVGSVLVNLNAIPLPEKYEGFVTAGLMGLYALSRGLAKAGVPKVEEDVKTV